MRMRRLGSLEVGIVGLGCNNFGRRIDEDASRAVVDACIEHGVTFFDTADVYGDAPGRSEEILGRALAGRRDEVLIATKFGMRLDDERSGAHPDYVRRACEDSLRRLGTDHVDLYQLHRPDESVPIAETLGALEELRTAGKVREVGCSNVSAAQIDEAERAAAQPGRARFVSVQNEWSVLHRTPERDGVVEACARLGLGVLPYYPLANGLLTGKYRRGAAPPPGSRIARAPAERRAQLLDERDLAVVERLEAFCAARGRTLLELAFSWLACQPVTASVIAGATKPEQVRANAAAADWVLDDEERAEIDRITGGGDAAA